MFDYDWCQTAIQLDQCSLLSKHYVHWSKYWIHQVWCLSTTQYSWKRDRGHRWFPDGIPHVPTQEKSLSWKEPVHFVCNWSEPSGDVIFLSMSRYDWSYPSYNNGSLAIMIKLPLIFLFHSPHRSAEIKVPSVENITILILSHDRCAQGRYFVENIVQDHFTER